MKDGEPGTEEGTGIEEDQDRKRIRLASISLLLAGGRKIDTRKGTIPKQSEFTCGSCGKQQDVRESLEQTGHSAPVAVYAIQGYCPECDVEGRIYGGRYFSKFKSGDCDRLVLVEQRMECSRKDDDLEELLAKRGDSSQLHDPPCEFRVAETGIHALVEDVQPTSALVHTQLLNASQSIEVKIRPKPSEIKALGAIQQYLRIQNMFVYLAYQTYDKIAPFFRNPNYAPKSTVVENNVLWTTRIWQLGHRTLQTVIEGLTWAADAMGTVDLPAIGLSYKQCQGLRLGTRYASRKRYRLLLIFRLSCLSRTVRSIWSSLILRSATTSSTRTSRISSTLGCGLPLRSTSIPNFSSQRRPRTPRKLLLPDFCPKKRPTNITEFDSPPAGQKPVACLRTAACSLSRSITARTRSGQSSSKACSTLGSFLEQTFPIASDEQKGEGGQFGAKGTEYDIIHVCRKRLAEPTPVSWAEDAAMGQGRVEPAPTICLDSYKASELSDADIRVILRGKAWSSTAATTARSSRRTMSRLSIRHALGGINQLLDEGTGSATEQSANDRSASSLSISCGFLRGRPSLSADDVSKSLFGTAIRQRDFEDRGWVEERNRRVYASRFASGLRSAASGHERK